MENMTIDQKCKCHAIIHIFSASTGAIGAGLAQLPCADHVVITPIQTAMAIAIARVFGIKITKSAAKSTLVSLAASQVGRAFSQLAFGWIPVAGNVCNAGTAAAITEAIGWLLAEDFAEQARNMKGTLVSAA